MGMTPDDFFQAFVLGNLHEFQADQGSVRCAFNAAVAATHMLDQYFHYFERVAPDVISEYEVKKDFVNYVKQATDGCYNDIRSITNAYKHLYVSGDHTSTVDSAGSVEVITVDEDEISQIEGGENQSVHFTRKGSDQKVELLPRLMTVVDFWQTMVTS